MKKTAAVFSTVLIIFLMLSCVSENARGELSAGTAADEKQSGSVFAMDTYMTVTAYGANAEKGIEAARNELTRLEKLWAVTDENSEIYALNHSGGLETEISPETEELLRFAKDMNSETGGALDISIYPVLKAWGFTTGEYRVPEESELSRLLVKKGADRITVSRGRASVPDGTEIDLGSVAKGYAGDLAAKAIKEQGVTSALLDLGGNIRTVGERKPDGSGWKVGIRDPQGNGLIGTVEIGEGNVITSGGYERYFERDGVIYEHILDPETGRPAKSGLASSTVIGSDGKLCDALSTSLYVMGLEKAIALWKSRNDFDMILITDEDGIYVTEGIENCFKASSGKVTVIR